MQESKLTVETAAGQTQPPIPQGGLESGPAAGGPVPSPVHGTGIPEPAPGDTMALDNGSRSESSRGVLPAEEPASMPPMGIDFARVLHPSTLNLLPYKIGEVCNSCGEFKWKDEQTRARYLSPPPAPESAAQPLPPISFINYGSAVAFLKTLGPEPDLKPRDRAAGAPEGEPSSWFPSFSPSEPIFTRRFFPGGFDYWVGFDRPEDKENGPDAFYLRERKVPEELGLLPVCPYCRKYSACHSNLGRGLGRGRTDVHQGYAFCEPCKRSFAWSRSGKFYRTCGVDRDVFCLLEGQSRVFHRRLAKRILQLSPCHRALADQQVSRTLADAGWGTPIPPATSPS